MAELQEPLKKNLGVISVFSVAAGAMISSGLFVLPGIAFAIAGPAVILAYAIAGLLMIPSLFATAELATAMPRSGGSYFFIMRSLGPLVGTFAGLGNWLAITFKTAFALVGIGSIFGYFFSDWGDAAVRAGAVGGCAVFTALNLLSVKSSGRVQSGFVFVLLGILAFYVFRTGQAVEGTRLIPFFAEGAGWREVFAVAGMVYISFGGLTKVVDIAEEVRDSKVNLPRGMFLAFAIVNGLYLLVVWATVGVVNADELAGSLVPISLGANAAMGSIGVVLIDLAALFAFITTANAGILSAARSPMAMSRDGVLPENLGRVSTRFGTPHVAILLTSGLIISVITFLSVEDLVKTASTIMLIMFTMQNVSVIVMRSSPIQNYRPIFKVPLYPWLPLFAIAVYGFLIFEMGTVPLALTGGLALLATVWYFVYVHARTKHESAFMYLTRSIISQEFLRSNLEDELRQIALERDEVKTDWFDRLVKECPVLDFEEPMTAKEAFRHYAAALSEQLDLPEDELYDKLLEREKLASTVVHPGIAIPHVIVKGDKVFGLLLARHQKGVHFPEASTPAQIVFVLVGSMDQRDHHLKGLMQIAHVVQEPGFEERWKAAHGPEELRDVVLLSTRQRQK
ncbi:MAG: amino acid permease [Candidatus Hydrogenedentota bacterium]